MNDRPQIPQDEGLTDMERVIDFGLALENRDRYIAQSVATTANNPAPLPPRAAAR